MMEYEDALKKALTVKWVAQECPTKDCWCAMVAPDQPITYVNADGEEEFITIIWGGAIERSVVEHIVDAHNKMIDDLHDN